MKTSLFGSTYILLTAKSSTDTYIVCLNCQTLKEKIVVQVWPYDKKNILTRRVRTCFIFLKFITNWLMKMHLKMIFDHKLAVAEIFFTDET